MGCCAGAFAPVAALLSSLGLGFLADLRVSLPLLYVSLTLTVGSLYCSYRRHRRPSALLVGLAGSIAVLIPFHVALETRVFFPLVYGGIASLLLAAITEALLQRSCRMPH